MAKYLARINLPTPRNPEPVGEAEPKPGIVISGQNGKWTPEGPVEIKLDKRRYSYRVPRELETEDELTILMEPKNGSER